MSRPFKLCILRLSAIGDVCHALAMVQAIQAHHQHIEITWVIGKIEYQLLKGLPGVDFVVYDKKGGSAAKREVKEALKDVVFDALFVMQVALRANLLSTVIKAKRRIGFDWQRSKEGHWWFVNERIDAQQHAHVLEGFMGFAACLGVDYKTPPLWSMPLEPSDRQWAAQRTQALGEYAVISPAASKAERNWLAQAYAQSADYLHQRGLKVVLCGGPGPLDAKLRDDIQQHTQHIALDLVGQTSLKQMLAILEGARMVIAPDTGPAHMATTVSTPVIGLYAHSNPRRTGPYLSLETTVSVYDECIEKQEGKPWQALVWGKRAKGENLMHLIEFDAVKERIDRLLEV